MQAEEIVVWIEAISYVVYKHFDSFIRGKRYTHSYYDPCMYNNKLPGGEYISLLLYVDVCSSLLRADPQLIN